MISGEIAILKWLEGLRSPFWNRFWEGVTLFGEDTVMIILVAILYFMIDKKAAHRICFLMVTSLGLNGILKNLIKMPRPFSTGDVSCVRPETATGYSFPSGHTQNFTTWSTAFAAYWKSRWLWIVALIGSAMMGFSRMFLGAHYFSDVAAALILGIGISLLGNYVYDKFPNKNKLYLSVFLGFTPFFLFFLWDSDPLFADFFKCYGLLGGFLVSVNLEEKYGDFPVNVPFWKKLIRMVVGIMLAIVLKEGIKNLWIPATLPVSLLWDSFRYFALVLVIFGMYPILIKKLNL